MGSQRVRHDWVTITHSLTQTVYIKKKTVMPRTSRVNTQLKQLIRIRIKKDPLTSVQFSCSVVSDSLQPHGLQHARLPSPSPTNIWLLPNWISYNCCCCLVAKFCRVFCDAHRLQPTSLCPWNFPGKDTGVVAISFSRGSSRPRDWTHISCLVGEFFIPLSHREVPYNTLVNVYF